MRFYDRGKVGRWATLLLAYACGWHGVAFAVDVPVVPPAPVSTFHELYILSPEQAQRGVPVRLKGVVVCYDRGWNQLYVHDGTETGWLDPQSFQTNPPVGSEVEITGYAASSQGGTILTNLQLQVLGNGLLPNAKALEISQLGSDFGQWIETQGRVRVTDISSGHPSLVLENKGQTCLVYVMGSPATNDFKWLLGCSVRIRGINASKTVGGQLESASVFAAGMNEVAVIEQASIQLTNIPVMSMDALLNREFGVWTNELVHVNGLITSYQPGKTLAIKDATGSIRAQVIQTTDAQLDQRVDLWGYLAVSQRETILRDAYFEIQVPRALSGPSTQVVQSLSEQTDNRAEISSFSEISRLRSEEAAQGFPVRLRGTVTYADPDWRNCFIQGQSGAMYVALTQSDITAGQWVEVTGQTSPGGFAPEVVNSNFRVLGVTNLPVPVRVDLQDLASGHWDSHWVQLEGVIRQVTEQWGHITLFLATPGGRFKAVVLKSSIQSVPANLIDALVSIQGACTSEMNARSQLTGISLRVPGFEQIKILEAVPANPFEVQAMPISSVAVFDADRLAGRRVKVAGTVTLVMAGKGFYVQDNSAGILVKSSQADNLHIGDSVCVLGFPAMGDFSPCLEEATFQRTGSASLPEPKLTTVENILLHGTNDAGLVRIEAYLVQPVPRSARPKLVLQSGSTIFAAHLTSQPDDYKRLDFLPGSLLQLTGVCSIQGGESHEPETLRLLLSDSQDVVLLRAPPWWTIRHTVMLAGGLGLGLLLAWGWSSSLRRRVREQTEIIRKNQQELLTASRKAGMAEVATSVLHNVGNVLNSVNVSACVVTETLRKSKSKNATRVANLIKEHAADLGHFLANDPKGRNLPDYLSKLGDHLAEENRFVLGEIESLTKNIDHIKDIVSMQQAHAKVGGLKETVKIADMIDDAFRMNPISVERHSIQIIREYDAVRCPVVTVEKHKVLQILVNIITNAKHACMGSSVPDKRLTVRITDDPERVTISFADNGVGIARENLTRIFSHGFTTSRSGHGFGLHGAAIAAREMGGSLVAQSDGLGQGATFTLELPKSQ